MKNLALFFLVLAFAACTKKETPDSTQTNTPQTTPKPEASTTTDADTTKSVEKELGRGKQVAIYTVTTGDSCVLEVRNLSNTGEKVIIEKIWDSIEQQNTKPCEASLTNQSIVFEDFNFDGKEDFRMVHFTPAGPNIPYLWFSADGKKYTQNLEFEEITSPKIDANTKTISSDWRSNAATYGKSIYKIENNKPIKIEEQVAVFNPDGSCTASMKRLVDGALKEIDSRPCPPEITGQ